MNARFREYIRVEVHYADVTLAETGATLERYLADGWQLTHCRPHRSDHTIDRFVFRFVRSLAPPA